MSTHNGIGTGVATADKQDGLGKILSQHLAVCKQILSKRHTDRTYYYLDTNAGCGYNPNEPSKDGSPIIFLKVVQDFEIQYQAWFIDIEEDNVVQLRQQIAPYKNCSAYLGDNRRWAPLLLKHVERGSYGLVYMDCNGAPDFNLLARLSQMPTSTKIDILIRCNTTAIKRKWHYSNMRLLNYLQMINKKHWLIRRLKKGDPWYWTFLLGMNWKGMNEWRKQGFHWMDSEKGKKILKTVNYTKEERNEMNFAGALL